MFPRLRCEPYPDGTAKLRYRDSEGEICVDITGDVLVEPTLLAFKTVKGGVFLIWLEEK